MEQHPGREPGDPAPYPHDAPPAASSYGSPVPYGTPASGPYGPSAQGYGVLRAEHPSGMSVLVLGILALVVCPVTGIFAIVRGNRALREIDANPGAYANRQNVVVGRVLGIVGVAVYGALLGVYLIVVLGVFAAVMGQRG